MSAQKKAPEKRLRAFHGNSFDDYFDTGMRNFPLPARMFLGIAVYACMAWTQFRWRWSVEDKEKLVDDKTPRVIVMNHGSMLDPRDHHRPALAAWHTRAHHLQERV